MMCVLLFGGDGVGCNLGRDAGACRGHGVGEGFHDVGRVADAFSAVIGGR